MKKETIKKSHYQMEPIKTKKSASDILTKVMLAVLIGIKAIWAASFYMVSGVASFVFLGFLLKISNFPVDSVSRLIELTVWLMQHWFGVWFAILLLEIWMELKEKEVI